MLREIKGGVPELAENMEVGFPNALFRVFWAPDVGKIGSEDNNV